MKDSFFVLLLAATLLLTGCESPRSASLREGLERDLAEVFRRQGVAPAELKCGLVIKPEEGTTCRFRATAEEVARIARGLRLLEVAGDQTPEEGARRGECGTDSDFYRLGLLQVYELPGGGEVTLRDGRSFGRLIVCHRRQGGEVQAVVAYKRGAG
jgi:hypothetical protein